MVFWKASSCKRTSSSAPMDRGFFITSIANDVPLEMTVIAASCESLISRAASTAFSSNPFTTGAMLGGVTTFFAPESTWKAEAGISGSITCLARTAIFNGIADSPRPLSVCETYH